MYYMVVVFSQKKHVQITPLPSYINVLYKLINYRNGLPGLNDEHNIWAPGLDFSLNLIGVKLKIKTNKLPTYKFTEILYTYCK